MNCPHGKRIETTDFYGVKLFVHEHGEICPLMNRLDVTCEEIAKSNAARATDLRCVYSSYKVSVSTRFIYLDKICAFDTLQFYASLEPIRLALISDDDFATAGLYLMELYYFFHGITERITAANDEITRLSLYRTLGDINVLRVLSQENETTRQYSRLLKSCYSGFENALTIPG